uniref:C2H2-type domain-containing protein n=1 Tax=Trichobilharzia regenti TaxID=157069 RepID=A0AA85J2K7_TRIRE
MNNKRLCVNRKSQSNLSLLRSSPGGILFSSVAGGPLHVHSPDRNSENFAAKSTDDPNIELPTISVREVDEILSSLTTPNSSPVKTASGTSGIINAHPNYCDTRDGLCHNVAQHNNKQSLEKNLFDGVECSPNPVETNSVKNANITERNLNGISQICIKSNGAGRISTSSTCRNAAENLSSSKYTLGNSFLRSTSFMCPERKRHTDTDLRTNQANRKNNTKTVSLQSMMDILPLFPSCRSVAELGALALGPESEKTTDHSFHKQKSVSLHPKACSGTNLCKPPFKMQISSSSRDRSPIGSLDLATHSRYQNASASSVQEATKYRQAYLSVRKANQAKVLSKSTTTVPSSVLESKNQDTPKNHHVSYQTPNNDQLTVHLKYNSDDRFKHICPHPRCGRRYQAEIGLLRHLVKYHGEQIELPRRTSSAANQRLVRRPASEERTITSVGFDETDEIV